MCRIRKNLNRWNIFGPLVFEVCLNFTIFCLHGSDCLIVVAGSLEALQDCLTWLAHTPAATGFRKDCVDGTTDRCEYAILLIRLFPEIDHGHQSCFKCTLIVLLSASGSSNRNRLSTNDTTLSLRAVQLVQSNVHQGSWCSKRIRI